METFIQHHAFYICCCEIIVVIRYRPEKKHSIIRGDAVPLWIHMEKIPPRNTTGFTQTKNRHLELLLQEFFLTVKLEVYQDLLKI